MARANMRVVLALSASSMLISADANAQNESPPAAYVCSLRDMDGQGRPISGDRPFVVLIESGRNESGAWLRLRSRDETQLIAGGRLRFLDFSRDDQTGSVSSQFYTDENRAAGYNLSVVSRNPIQMTTVEGSEIEVFDASVRIQNGPPTSRGFCLMTVGTEALAAVGTEDEMAQQGNSK